MAAAPTSSSATLISFDRPAQIRAVLVGLAFFAVFYNVLLNLAYAWTHSADWSHGWLIPLFSAYLVHARWAQVRRAPPRFAWLGLPVILAALALYQYSLWGLRIGYIRPFSMLLCLLGIIIYLCGLPILRHVWVPWLYLFFAVPIPKGYYFQLTDPLRRMAAVVTTHVLSLAPGLDIEKVGSTIHYVYQGQSGALGVADACAGMRSAMTLCALGVAISFVSERPWWQRLIMIASCVPIAIFANFIRVTTTCVLHIYVDPRYATGTYHIVLGLVTLLIAFGIFSGLGWILSHLFIEVPEDQAAQEQSG